MLGRVLPASDLVVPPLGVGQMIDRAVGVVRRHFGRLFVAMLLVQAPAFALLRVTSARTAGLLEALADPGALATRAAGLSGFLVAVLAAMVVLQFAATAVVAAIVAPSLGGRAAAAAKRPGAAPARRVAAALTAGLLQLLVLALAPALGALPGLLLAFRAGSTTTAFVGLAAAALGALLGVLVALLRTVLAPAVAAVEGLGGWRALRRSGRLMAPRPGQPPLERPGVRASLLLFTTFALALAVNGLASLPRLAASRLAGAGPLALLPGGLPPALELALALLEACAGAALQPFSLAAVVVFYFERRARTEGLDLEAWAAALEAGR
jgi:hypothetical protein